MMSAARKPKAASPPPVTQPPLASRRTAPLHSVRAMLDEKAALVKSMGLVADMLSGGDGVTVREAAAAMLKEQAVLLNDGSASPVAEEKPAGHGRRKSPAVETSVSNPGTLGKSKPDVS